MSDETLSFWDQQFRFASILPDFQHWLNVTTQQSADFNAIHPAPEILHYGSHPRQFTELFSIATNITTETPLLPVFVHGGFWRAQAAPTYRSVMAGLSAFGPVQANLEYRLIPEVRMADVVDDVKTALHQLLEYTEQQYPLLLFGHSAGGHLIMEAVLDTQLQNHIAAAIPISGIFDLTTIPHSFLQTELALTNDEVQRYSPQLRLPNHLIPCQVLAVVGAQETYEFHRQAEILALSLQCPVLRLANAHHMNVLQGLTTADTPFTTAIQNFLSDQPIPASVEVNA